ncbi:MAG: hypothetical protein IJ466_07985 [Clostridia bacterium]|nr:hypothetical protein [Clostridia bacterium]
MIVILLIVIGVVIITFALLVNWGEKDDSASTYNGSPAFERKVYAHENTSMLPKGFWERLDALMKNGAPENFWDTVDFLVCLGEAMSIYDDNTLIEVSIRRMSALEARENKHLCKQDVFFFDIHHAQRLYGNRYGFLNQWDSHISLRDISTTATFLEESRICEMLLEQGLQDNPQAPHAYIAKIEHLKYNDEPCPRLNIQIKYRNH